MTTEIENEWKTRAETAEARLKAIDSEQSAHAKWVGVLCPVTWTGAGGDIYRPGAWIEYTGLDAALIEADRIQSGDVMNEEKKAMEYKYTNALCCACLGKEVMVNDFGFCANCWLQLTCEERCLLLRKPEEPVRIISQTPGLFKVVFLSVLFSMLTAFLYARYLSHFFAGRQ